MCVGGEGMEWHTPFMKVDVNEPSVYVCEEEVYGSVTVRFGRKTQGEGRQERSRMCG